MFSGRVCLDTARDLWGSWLVPGGAFGWKGFWWPGNVPIMLCPGTSESTQTFLKLPKEDLFLKLSSVATALGLLPPLGAPHGFLKEDPSEQAFILEPLLEPMKPATFCDIRWSPWALCGRKQAPKESLWGVFTCHGQAGQLQVSCFIYFSFVAFLSLALLILSGFGVL